MEKSGGRTETDVFSELSEVPWSQSTETCRAGADVGQMCGSHCEGP
jgi:hypothetical protein